MFPLTVFCPHSWEGWLVCFADKWCALCETFGMDVSSYIIYRVNLHYELLKGNITLGRKHGSDGVSNLQETGGGSNG